MIKKIFSDKKNCIVFIIFILLILVGTISFVYAKIKSHNRIPEADELIEYYISSINSKSDDYAVASIQKTIVKIDTSEGKAEYSAENRRDKDTDHIIADFSDNYKGTEEIYADKIDQQVGIYRKATDNLWEFELKPKQSAVDDPRTEYIEVSTAGNELKLSDFTDLKMEESDNENTYKVTAQINGKVMFSILGNNYQIIYINYDSIASYLAKYNENFTLRCTMYFDKKTKLLSSVCFKGNENSFDVCNKASTGITIKALDIKMTNESYEKSNVYVSTDIEKITKTTKSLQTDRLFYKYTD